MNVLMLLQVWNYVYLLVRLREVALSSMNGLEASIYDKLKNEDAASSWFPINQVCDAH